MKDETMSRRSALRTVLSLGCGLCLPAVMVGCDTKSPGTSAGTSAGAAPAPAPAATDAAKKVPPASVQYQAQPKGEQQCGGCTHFIAGENACALVEGPISSEGWCVLWAKKA